MNYLEEYNNILAEDEIRSKNCRDYSCDCTYSIFEQFIMDVLPIVIENALRNKRKEVVVYYKIINKFTNYKAGYKYGTLEAYNKQYGEINLEEFNLFLNQIPIKCFSDSGMSYFQCELKDIIIYYYEELQRIEYQTGKSR
ncbi:MAG: hypothetical protein E7163_02690 [Firmicutes bacterium]|nr:hypothetical protein [Bacillota bacterium]